MAEDKLTTMAAPLANTGDGKPKFVPKRRTPYLLQDEVIKERQNNQNNSAKTENVVEQTSHNLVIESHIEPHIEPFSRNLAKEGVEEINRSLKGVKSESKSRYEIDYMEEVSRICGIQKRLLYFFVQCCEVRNGNDTGPIIPETMCNAAKTTYKTVKKMLQRMSENQLIIRKAGKKGKGGFTRFELKKEVIEIVKIHKNIESNYFGNPVNLLVNNQELHYQDSSSLPNDWEKIEFQNLIDAFNANKKISSQYFGKSQIKAIYLSAGNKLFAGDVQNSINSFAYGYKNYLDCEPYKNMKNPAGVLVERLKNGDKWHEAKYLTPHEETIYKIFKNVSKNIQEKCQEYFYKWVEKNREEKFKQYKDSMRSNEWFDENVFMEKAWKEYSNNEWLREKINIVGSMIGVEDHEMLSRFEEKLKMDVVHT